MITQLPQLYNRVSIETRPQDILLQKESWVYFSPAWPGTHKWASGKLFEVSEEPIVVSYPVSYILPGDDYKDVDLSNSTAGLKLYPESEGVLYQALVGIKPGDFLVHIYVPKDKYVYALGESSMYPDVTDASKKYLGAKTYADSPYNAPMLQLYFIKDMPAFYFRFYVLEGVDFEKCTVIFQINKCKLTEIEEPDEDMIKKATRIDYYTELSGF